MRTLIYILLTIITSSSLAGSLNDAINQYRVQREHLAHKISTEPNVLAQYQTTAKQKIPQYQIVVQKLKDDYLKASQAPSKTRLEPNAMLFVSFSLPDASLKQIIHDATRYQIPVVWRGLYQNSFRLTMEKLFALFKDGNKGGALINPVWFKKYHINAVPALVVTKGQDFEVVYGNLPLATALNIIATKGRLAAVAKELLQRGVT